MQTDEAYSDADMLGMQTEGAEACAACGEVIALDRLGKSACRNGHEWCTFSFYTK